MLETKQIQEALAEPFAPEVIGWKPGVVSGNRALALAYIDARDVADRLDAVLGIAGWQDDYQVLDHGSVLCRLSLLIGGNWLTKQDVGSESEQSDQGDKRKAAFSDALKRAGIKWGIGRYLYRLEQAWYDYDPQKKRFLKAPQLPPWALPQKPKPTTTQQQANKPVKEVGMAILNVAWPKGVEALTLAWKTLSPEIQKACESEKESLKEKAIKAGRGEHVVA